MAEERERQAAAAVADKELLKIPLWFADESKDAFTAEYWVKRMDRIKETCGWSPAHTALHACNALRGKAVWFLNHLETMDAAAVKDWDLFKKAFLKHFGISGKDTSKIANLNVTQNTHEKVQVFAYRVTMTVEEFFHCLPETQEECGLGDIATIAITTVTVPADAAAAATLRDGITEHSTKIAKHYHKRAYKNLFQGICKTLFLNGLLPSIRGSAKLLTTDSFEDAISSAITAERAINGPLDKVTSTDKNVNFVKKRSFRPSRPNTSVPPSVRRTGECWYCHQKGHVQLHCRKRLSRGAALVSKPRSVHDIQAEDIAYQDVEDDAYESDQSAEEDTEQDNGEEQINALHLN